MTQQKKAPVTNVTGYSKVQNNSKLKPAKSQAYLNFDKLKPWPEPVDGSKLVQELYDVFQRHLVLPNGASYVLPLWVLHTYALDSFDYTPRLCIYSPVPRCGKTQLLQLLEMTVYRPLNTSGITAAGMFRVIEFLQPTLLIDEADCYLNGDATIRSVINAGYKKGGIVIRTEETKNGFLPKKFNCYAAMAIAGIGARDDTVMDRSIVVIMKRRKPTDTIEKLRPTELSPLTEKLRRKCLRFMNDNASAISKSTPDMPKFLNDRASDIWEPLFAIAHLISPELVADLTGAASQLVQTNDDSDVLEIQLLADIHQAFNEIECDFISTTDLLEYLHAFENRPWGEIQYGKPMLTPIKLAKHLCWFQIKPIQRRIDYARVRGYERNMFQDAFERYLPELNCDTVTPQDTPDLPCHDVTDMIEPPVPDKPENIGTESDENSQLWYNEQTKDAIDATFSEATKFMANNSISQETLDTDDDLDIPY